MKRFAVVFFCLLLCCAATCRAQVAPAATTRQFSLSAGAMGSLFQPDFTGDWAWNSQDTAATPIAEASPQGLFGVGAFVDVKFTRWIQIEGEGRWMRLNQYQQTYEDNYLAGPRIPLRRFGRFTVYGKALGGWANVPYGPGLPYHSYTDVALGGGADYQLSKKFSLRAVDFEYQRLLGWPGIGPNQSIAPYGVSAGIAYRIF